MGMEVGCLAGSRGFYPAFHFSSSLTEQTEVDVVPCNIKRSPRAAVMS